MQHATIELVHQPHGSNDSDDMDLDRHDLGVPPVVVTFMVPRPEAESARVEPGKVARGDLERAGESAGLLGGFAITGPRYSMRRGTAFEQLLGLHAHESGDRRDWVRSHVRSPGWAVLAPEKAPLGTGRRRDRVDRKRLAHATLIMSTTKDPFAMTDADLEAVERFVMPALGSEAEVRGSAREGT